MTHKLEGPPDSSVWYCAEPSCSWQQVANWLTRSEVEQHWRDHSQHAGLRLDGTREGEIEEPDQRLTDQLASVQPGDRVKARYFYQGEHLILEGDARRASDGLWIGPMRLQVEPWGGVALVEIVEHTPAPLPQGCNAVEVNGEVYVRTAKGQWVGQDSIDHPSAAYFWLDDLRNMHMGQIKPLKLVEWS